MSVELVYFNGPGRGELPRLCLHAGGVAFKDTKINGFEEFAKLKTQPDFIVNEFFGSMPIIIDGDFKIAQSVAVSAYAGSLSKVGEGLTNKQRGTDLMIQGLHADLQSAMYGCVFGTDESKKAALQGLPTKLDKWLPGLEKHLPESGFIHGRDVPSVGDLAVFDFVSSKFPGLLALKQDLSAYPKLLAHVEKVKTYEPLQAYLSSRGF